MGRGHEEPLTERLFIKKKRNNLPFWSFRERFLSSERGILGRKKAENNRSLLRNNRIADDGRRTADVFYDPGLPVGKVRHLYGCLKDG
jgi:hypothetical protein